MLEVVLALVAALLFALGTVLQQREAQRASGSDALKAGFILQLARRPVWLAGMAADGIGYVAQAAALGIGRIVVVQPILATTVVFALPLGSVILGQRVGRRELLAALAVTAGLGVFLVVADPSGGREDATTAGWIVTFVVAAAVCVPLVLAGRAAKRAPVKAALLGTATGVLWGLSACLTKAVVEDLDEGVIALLDDWQTYALVAVGWASLTLAQASLQAGALAAAVATQAAVDPVTSVLIGVFAFDESIHGATAGAVASLGGFVVMVAGIVVLAASSQSTEPEPESKPA